MVEMPAVMVETAVVVVAKVVALGKLLLARSQGSQIE